MERFVANGWPSVQTLSPKLNEALKDYGMAVCDVERVSLPPGSPAHILVSLDVNRRGFCNSVLRITTVGRPRVLDSLRTWQLERVRDALVDVDLDGEVELVLRRAITPYEGATNCIATTPSIYECSAVECSSTGDRDAGYLTRELERLERQLRIWEAHSNEELSCAIIEVDKLRRRLKIDPRAGARTAEQWMKASNPKLRSKAVFVFEDIGDEDARQKLNVLAKDADGSVASRARTALKRQ